MHRDSVSGQTNGPPAQTGSLVPCSHESLVILDRTSLRSCLCRSNAEWAEALDQRSGRGRVPTISLAATGFRMQLGTSCLSRALTCKAEVTQLNDQPRELPMFNLQTEHRLMCIVAFDSRHD